MIDINELLEDISPEGKTIKDFTGGYVQQLKNSSRFIAFFGTKPGTNNKSTVNMKIPADELDLFYMMLKAKIHEMRNEDSNVRTISMAQRRLDRKASKEEPF